MSFFKPDPARLLRAARGIVEPVAVRETQHQGHLEGDRRILELDGMDAMSTIPGKGPKKASARMPINGADAMAEPPEMQKANEHGAKLREKVKAILDEAKDGDLAETLQALLDKIRDDPSAVMESQASFVRELRRRKPNGAALAKRVGAGR